MAQPVDPDDKKRPLEGVLAGNGLLVDIKAARLVEDLFGDVEFTDIVEHGAEVKIAHLGFRQAQFSPDAEAVFGNPLGLPLGIGILHLQGASQGLDGAVEQTLIPHVMVMGIMNKHGFLHSFADILAGQPVHDRQGKADGGARGPGLS